MTDQIEDTADVRQSIEVNAAPPRAFDVFTGQIDRWWPAGVHVLPGEDVRTGVEPFVGGRVWEEDAAGRTCTWGRVLTWEPPHRFAFAWLLGPDFAVPAPGTEGSRVTVTFTGTERGTRVDLVHDRLEAHGDQWQALRAAVRSDGGWPLLLAEFAAAV